MEWELWLDGRRESETNPVHNVCDEVNLADLVTVGAEVEGKDRWDGLQQSREPMPVEA